MQNYEGSMTGRDNVRCGGATNGGDAGRPDAGPASGGVAPVITGSPTPTIVKTGATNGGK